PASCASAVHFVSAPLTLLSGCTNVCEVRNMTLYASMSAATLVGPSTLNAQLGAAPLHVPPSQKRKREYVAGTAFSVVGPCATVRVHVAVQSTPASLKMRPPPVPALITVRGQPPVPPTSTWADVEPPMLAAVTSMRAD